MENIESLTQQLTRQIESLELADQVAALNLVREKLHEISPFASEPVDFVKWIPKESVQSNDYNPNKVAPPEMKLLELSIHNDGYTQPIVAWSQTDKDGVEVVDGFHRSRVGKESKAVGVRVHGYLPVVDIRSEQSGKNDRMASTIRHNRARGKHQVDAMSEIVIELKNRNWRNARIARELGMDEEEVLRLCQISGLESLFSDKDFSRAWEADDAATVDEWQDLTDEVDDDLIAETRIPHQDREDRIFHTYDKWECHTAGFYASSVEGKSKDELVAEYVDFFGKLNEFESAAMHVVNHWEHSCEHYLTNHAMNRIAWIGQAAICYARGVPSKFCSGFSLLPIDQQEAANKLALKAINYWMRANWRPEITMEEALSAGRQVEIY